MCKGFYAKRHGSNNIAAEIATILVSSNNVNGFAADLQIISDRGHQTKPWVHFSAQLNNGLPIDPLS